MLALAGAACGGADNAAAPSAERRSVVLVVVDALRADHLGTYGYARPTSPNIDAWAERGRVFEVTRRGRIVWQFEKVVGEKVYRAHRVETGWPLGPLSFPR